MTRNRANMESARNQMRFCNALGASPEAREPLAPFPGDLAIL
jgi:hypothetical protein